MIRYFNRQGEPITRDEWSDLMGYDTDRRVALTERDGIRVSTVWLGLDHGFGGPPLIFETMIFGGQHDQYQRRYTTEAEALEGHKAAVAKAFG